jgi:hypothetical protein
MLQFGDGVRRPHVVFAADAIGVFAAGVERVFERLIVAERQLVLANRFFHHLEDADAFDLRRGSGEVLVDHLFLQADGLEDLRAGVGHVGRDAHLGHDLEQALADALDEVLDRLFRRVLVAADHLLDRLEREVGVNRFGAVAGEQAKWWVSRAEPVSTTRPARVRRPRVTRC